MLWKFTNTNKYGNLRSRIVYAEGALKVGRGFGSFLAAQRFRYESRSPYFGLVELKGKKFLTTDWIEVHPQTTLVDIKYEAPVVVETPIQKNEWMFEVVLSKLSLPADIDPKARSVHITCIYTIKKLQFYRCVVLFIIH